ncbi:hypothetical protein [Streptomyces sp. NPDC029674]|uniref:hypothetical protein n=1 Tax=Streptomyces sp. NPDC029674 TaxID=3365297 RepID=UPI00384CDFFF
MDLRPELLPPPVPPRRLAALSREIERVAALVLDGDGGEAVTAFNAATGHRYGPLDFVEYEGWRSLEEFAREAARPAWPRVPDATRDELVEIVRRVLADPGSTDCEYYLLLLAANVPHPRARDLVLAGDGAGAAARVVDELLNYRAISL